MPRFFIFTLTALCLAFPGCHLPENDPSTQPATQPESSETQPATQFSESHSDQPATQTAATHPATQPVTLSTYHTKERKVLELTPGLTFEQVQTILEDPFVFTDSFSVEINCPPFNTSYRLAFIPNPADRNIILHTVEWSPNDQFVPQSIIILPKDLAGFTSEEAFLKELFPPPQTFTPPRLHSDQTLNPKP